MSTILDSGARREIGTGAVRDIAEGKGRADLLPIDIVAQLLRQDDYIYDEVLFAINQYVRTDIYTAIIGALWTHDHKPELIDLPFKQP